MQCIPREVRSQVAPEITGEDHHEKATREQVREMAEGLVGSLWQSLVACRPEERGAREEALAAASAVAAAFGGHHR